MQEFSETFSDKPGRTTLLNHDSKLTTDTPVRVKQYPLPFSMLETVGDEVRSMIDLGVLERSDSPYCSPVVIIKKKDNSNHFCLDFRVLNKITVFDAEPMPSMVQIFSKLLDTNSFQSLTFRKVTGKFHCQKIRRNILLSKRA